MINGLSHSLPILLAWLFGAIVWCAPDNAGCSTLADAEIPGLRADAFKRKLAETVSTASKGNIPVVEGAKDWWFLTEELRFLSVGQFWGEAAAAVSQSADRNAVDPMVAIVDFNRRLTAIGVRLLVVPVPPKSAIYPEKLFPAFDGNPADLVSDLEAFYKQLQKNDVEVVDLLPVFYSKRADTRGPLYCRTDSHWSGIGCVVAAETIAARIRALLQRDTLTGEYVASWDEVTIQGDLVELLQGQVANGTPEKIQIRKIRASEGNTTIEPDSNSPVLLMGDSHTLVFHDFLAQNAGLLDQLTLELGLRPDLIGTRGSGATPVRLSLYRRSIKEPGYLGRKKVVIWCFSAREFTEGSQGWKILPITR